MMHDDLLVLAGHLARLEPGRPKQVSLRRAVSTAYYAVFHALAALCAEELVGWSRPWEHFAPIYRSLEHAAAKKLFHRNGATYGREGAVIGNTFILLQERRHTADYDPLPFPFGRSETLELIEQARQAIQTIRALPSERRMLLAVNLIAKQRS
jgi:hypothetical protein